MAYEFTGGNGVGQDAISYTLNSAQVGSTQLTIARWLQPQNTSQYRRDFHFGAASPNQTMLMQFDDAWGWVFAIKWSTQFGNWSIAKPTINTDVHCAVTYDGASTANDPIIYTNGVSQTITERTAPSGSLSWASSTALYLGSEANTGQYWDGHIWEWALWNRVLPPDDIAALAKGYSPLCFPRGLTIYIPLLNGYKELIFGIDGTAQNTPTKINHNNIIYPKNIVTAFAKSTGGAYTQTLSDNINLSDSLSRSVVRTGSDIFLFSESITKIFSATKSENINITSAELKALSKNQSDSINITDSVSTIKSATRSLTDTLNITSTVATIGTFLRTLTDTIDTTSTIARLTSRAYSESINLTSALTYLPTKILIDTLNMTSSIVTLRTTYKSLSDNIDLSSAIAKSFTTSLSDTIALLENFDKLKAIFTQVSDSVILNDTIIKQKNAILSDLLTLTEAFSKSSIRTINDSYNLNDTLTKVLSNSLQLNDFISLTESLSKYLQRSINENIGISDTIQSLKVYLRNLSDSIYMFEVAINAIEEHGGYATGMYGTMPYAGQPYNNYETRALIFDFSRPVNENLSLTSVLASAALILGRSLTDTIGMTDTITKLVNGLSILWTKISKQSGGIWTKVTKSTGIWTKVTKSTGIWTKEPKI